MFVTPEPLADRHLAELVHAACQLHQNHGLGLDREVDYAVKLHATCNDVAAAVSLCSFLADDDMIEVQPVVVEPWFLNSKQFRLRLLLNALTSPHSFLGGNVALYEKHRQAAERAVAMLALSLHHGQVITLSSAVAAITLGPDGASKKDYLGYAANTYLISVLHRGLAQLAAEGIVRDVDGSCFTLDQAVLHAVITALRRIP
ncbi:hypothetical protein [Phytoactinopolyspora mesophila]|uniref:Uncharacterized protein n=1 Tax=Phytoactinopolyspora mesophila TaxID=2650750 RepID=A0A7K3MA54_9ACTN|nr:hypothetical protein [Phytoactinopolyspora mesophila]NDL60195.1 hypothetical protein [Phytoactinopolyspora mesophila]